MTSSMSGGRRELHRKRPPPPPPRLPPPPQGHPAATATAAQGRRYCCSRPSFTSGTAGCPLDASSFAFGSRCICDGSNSRNQAATEISPAGGSPNMAEISEAAVRKALETVIDPASGRNVLVAGMVAASPPAAATSQSPRRRSGPRGPRSPAPGLRAGGAGHTGRSVGDRRDDGGTAGPTRPSVRP